MMQTQERQQHAIEKLEHATRKLSQADSPEEQQSWAQQARTYASEIAFSKQQSKTALQVEASVSTTEPLRELSEQVDNGRLRGVREITYRRDADGQGRIRISATQEALGQATEVLQTFGQHVERSNRSNS